MDYFATLCKLGHVAAWTNHSGSKKDPFDTD